MLFCVVSLTLMLVTRILGIAERLAYMPIREDFPDHPIYEDVWITTPNGTRLHGWFMRAEGVAPGERAPAVIHAHGNAGNIQYHEGFSRFLTERGVHVLLFEYRGYGRSDPGTLRRDPLLEDTHAALDHLLARDDVDPDRVGAYGVSLGGAFAISLASDRDEIRSLCTLSTFSTWRDVAHDWLPVVGPLVFPGGWDPIDRVPGLGDRPWLVLHGDADRVIDPRHATRLGETAHASGVDAVVATFPGADHNSILDTHPAARRAIADFFADTLGVVRDGIPPGRP